MKKSSKKTLQEISAYLSRRIEEALPLWLFDKANPSDQGLKQMFQRGADNDGLPKEDGRIIEIIQTSLDNVIKPAWRWPSYEAAACELGIGVRTLERDVNCGRACKPDLWNGRAWFVPCSYYHLAYDERNKLFEENKSWTDVSGSY
jgi:hypothetical protein